MWHCISLLRMCRERTAIISMCIGTDHHLLTATTKADKPLWRVSRTAIVLEYETTGHQGIWLFWSWNYFVRKEKYDPKVARFLNEDHEPWYISLPPLLISIQWRRSKLDVSQTLTWQHILSDSLQCRRIQESVQSSAHGRSEWPSCRPRDPAGFHPEHIVSRRGYDCVLINIGLSNDTQGSI